MAPGEEISTLRSYEFESSLGYHDDQLVSPLGTLMSTIIR